MATRKGGWTGGWGWAPGPEAASRQQQQVVICKAQQSTRGSSCWTLGTGRVREEAALGSPARRSERTGALLGTLTRPAFWNTNVFITEEMLLL